MCEAAILVASVILLLFGWGKLSSNSTISIAAGITNTVAILATVSLVLGVSCYFWTADKYRIALAYAVYVSICATVITLIAITGILSSPYIALWILVAAFAGIFGLLGLFPLTLIVSTYLFIKYFDNTLNAEIIATSLLVGVLPLVLSFIIWHSRSEHESNKDKAYKQLATELDQVANKSEVVINAIGDGVIAIDSKGAVQLINPAAQRMIGHKSQDALTLDYKLILKLSDKHDNPLTTANDPVYTVLNQNHTVRDDSVILTTQSGKKVLLSLTVSPIGQPGSGALIVFRDITNEKKEERQQAEFISTASHEMRTPVASIEGYLGLALNPSTATIDDKAREYIKKAQDSAQHLGRLFQDLLDVTRAEDGRLSNNPRVVNIVAFTQDIFNGLKSQAEQKGLQTLFKPSPDESDASGRRLNPVMYVNLDNDHLREIIGNLIENAIKYTISGKITVDVTGDLDKVTITVEDTGIGIPAEDMPHLFQKFYRVDNTDTREIGGTGLGLYLCRRLVEAMSGRIWVESEYKKGSVFYVELPRINNEEASLLIEQANEKGSSNEPAQSS